MKILVAVAMLIVFISVIFILFILDDMGNRYMECGTVNGRQVCSVDIGVPLMMGFLFMGAFVLIDALVVYFLIKTIRFRGSLDYGG
jgi:hypothetical protein